jgi:hypothetical protein
MSPELAHWVSVEFPAEMREKVAAGLRNGIPGRLYQVLSDAAAPMELIEFVTALEYFDELSALVGK